RLERIRQILGEEWNTPAGALEIQLALRILRVSAAGPRAVSAPASSASAIGPRGERPPMPRG
ncbi:hypothetical protein GTW69_31300, partial [Streptomyces sp. SID7760]|nr:hypothetical protein [Streptomyces sp. SID7760]